jgi:hypothetical protein
MKLGLAASVAIVLLLLVVSSYASDMPEFAITPKPTRPGWVGASAQRIRNLLETFTPGPTSAGCVDFSSHVNPYSWGTGSPPPTSFTDQLLDVILTQTPFRCIMIYDIYTDIIAAAQTKGIKVLTIIWLTLDPNANAAQLTKAVAASVQYPTTIVGFSCGSELAYRNGLTDQVSEITLDCLYGLKAQGVLQPIGVIDSLKTYNYNWTAIAANVDFFGVNIYVWYDNTMSPPQCLTVDRAASQTLSRFRSVQARYPLFPFIMTGM